MVKVVKFPAGSQNVGNKTPHLEIQYNPRPCVSRDPDLVQNENSQCQKSQWCYSTGDSVDQESYCSFCAPWSWSTFTVRTTKHVKDPLVSYTNALTLSQTSPGLSAVHLF